MIAPMIAATGTLISGASYAFLDNARESAEASSYYLEDIDVYGKVTRHGPISIDRGRRDAGLRDDLLDQRFNRFQAPAKKEKTFVGQEVWRRIPYFWLTLPE